MKRSLILAASALAVSLLAGCGEKTEQIQGPADGGKSALSTTEGTSTPGAGGTASGPGAASGASSATTK